MDFSDQIKQFASKVEKTKGKCVNEAATKLFLINPFLRLMGYDTTDPDDVFPEYTADIGTKKGEKVDYAILHKGEPLVLIEAKCCGDDLSGHRNQLIRYFTSTSAKFGILTDGIIYKFYTDLDEANKMDKLPFLEFDMLNLHDYMIAEIKKFHKDVLDVDDVLSTAEELKYSNAIKDLYSTQLKQPTESFIVYMLSEIYSGKKTQPVIDKFKPIVKKALNDFISEMMTDKFSKYVKEQKKTAEGSVETNVAADVNIKPDTSSEKDTVTSIQIEAFNIIRGMLSDSIDIDKITYRRTETYLNILYEDNARKWIGRLRLEGKNPTIAIPDNNKKEVRYPVSNINSLCEYKTKLLNAIEMYSSTSKGTK